jgi:two-component system, OmpR family, sensor histidine kinase MtrB
MAELVAPRQFRLRLTLVCIAIAGLSGGLLAVTSYLAIRQYRVHSFEDQADRKVELAMLLLPARPQAARVEAALADYKQRGGFETIAVAGGSMFSSAPGLTVDDVPPGMRRSRTHDGHAHVTVNGVRYFVVGRTTDDRSVDLYFFFAVDDVLGSIEQFRTVLFFGWVATVAVAAVAGHEVARRTLRPVREAALASRRLAARLLPDHGEPRSTDEFGVWVESFNDVASALEAKITELSELAERERQFTSDVAHELRTPLTAMTSSAAMIEDRIDELPEHAREPARLLVRDVHRLRDLVLELLELARLDAGNEPVHLERISLASALRSVVRPWRERTAVELDVDEELTILADRARFKRVLTNLLDNAVEHGGGNVVVRAGAAGDRVEIQVCDHGPGIAPDALEHVFDRFFKADQGRSGRGSGLGLAIALAHAQAQGGTLEAENIPGSGACFTLSLQRGLEPATPEPVSS